MQKIMLFFLVLTALIFLQTQVYAQMSHDHMGSNASIYEASGVVTEINRDISQIVIDHGPIEALGWGPMDMPFKVNDMSLLKGVKTGDKVHFFISVTTDVNGHGEYIIVDLEKE